MQGLLLGLANGTACVAYCAPALVPYLMGEGKGIRANFLVLGEFLLGRLFGYLIFGIVAWLANRLLLEHLTGRELILGAVYVVLAVSLAIYGFPRRAPKACPAARSQRLLRYARARKWIALPLALGFLTGLNLCPPFLLAMAGAGPGSGLAHSVVFFMFFFLGTSVYFIPAPFIGALSRYGGLRTIGKLSAVVIAIYYFFLGAVMLGGGALALWSTP